MIGNLKLLALNWELAGFFWEKYDACNIKKQSMVNEICFWAEQLDEGQVYNKRRKMKEQKT